VTCLAATALTVTAVVLGAPVATATESPNDGQVHTVTAGENVQGDYGTSSYTKSCFGNTGRFADGSHVLSIDWYYDVPECFGVAPNGTIWHTWQGAAKWYEMRGNGLATDMNALIDWGNGDRTVQVYVGWASSKYYCQDYNYGSGWTGSWRRC
jgi:hypothetical protein